MKIFFVTAFFAWIFITPKTAYNPGPAAGKPWNLPLNEEVSIPMSWIPAGTFMMGSPESETGRKDDEGPRHKVTLTHGYWMGKTEITIGQWQAITGMNVRDKVLKLLSDTTIYEFNGKKRLLRDYMGFDKNNPDKVLANEDADLPMYFVSWYEAMRFCQKLTEQEHAAHRLPAGYEYTLPTEAQWEYACRAGTTSATYATPTSDIAWYVANSYQTYKGKGLGNPNAGPHDVGGKLANKWGMQDMLGNIWEWCRDWYGPYQPGDETDPAGPQIGSFKVNRGGTFGSGIGDERSAARAQNPPNEDSAYRGFRIALCRVQ